MNRILFIIIPILFLSQDKNDIDFLNYHKKFIEIEELIVSERFNEAENKLNYLLITYKPNFTKDYVILSQLCLLNNHKSNSIHWLRESMKYGAKLDCLKGIQLLNENITESEWKKLEEKALELNTIYHSKINFTLGVHFNKNYQKEQNSKSKKSYKSIVYKNYSKIKALTDKGSFPGEYLIGIDNADFAPKIYECDFGNSKIMVTLLHYDYPVTELTENTLVNAIERGQLHPRDFAAVFTFEKNRISKLYRNSSKVETTLSDYNFMFPFEKRANSTDKVNADRLTFGICNLETDKGKKQIEKKYGMKLTFGYR